MKKNTGIFLLVFFVIVFAYALIFWADNSPIGSDGHSSPSLDPEIELAFSFASALQMNDPDAYEMIDPNQKLRLDEWMNSHKSQECIGEDISSFIRDGTNLGKKISFSCFTKTSRLDFEVDDIVIKDLKVIDWGEVREED